MNIYLITNLTSGKQYVGRSKHNNPEYFGSGTYLNKAIEKYGKENFKKEILIGSKEIASFEEQMLLESTCILSLNTLYPNGYNLIFSDWPLPLEISQRAGKITGLANKKLKRGFFAPENLGKGGKIGGQKIFENKTGVFAPGMAREGGRNKAHTIFEIDGLIQRTILGVIFEM